MKDRLLQQAAAYDKIASSAKNATNAQFKMNEQQKIQLTYQTTDLVTQIASGQSPFIAILQQGGQLKDVMGGIGNMFRAIGTLFTPFTVGLGAVAVGLGSVAIAAYQAADDLDKLRDALTLTGNYSGVTEASFQKLANTLSGATNASLGTTKEALMAVISSGQFTGESINAVTQAIITYSQIAGVSATEAAQKLKGGLSGTAEGAKSLNKEMNFLTLEQYKQIEALEKANKKQEAAQVVAVALNTKLAQQRRELGFLEGAWKTVTTAMSNYWEKFKEFLTGPTQSQTLDALDKQISDIKQKLSGTSEEEDTVFARGWRKTLASLQASKENLLEIQRLQNRSTASKAVGSAKEKIDEYDKYKGMLKSKADEVAKAEAEAKFAVAKQGLNEIQMLELEAAKKLEDARREMNEKNRQEDGRATSQNLAIFKSKEIAISAETAEKVRQIRNKTMMSEYEEFLRTEKEKTDAEVAEENRRQTIRTSNQSRTKDMEYQKESLDLKYKLIYATEKEQRLAQISLEYARKRKEVEEGPDKQFNLDQIDRQEQMAKMFVTMEDSMKRTQEVFDSVWGNMSSAIDNFVKTGKLNMKDFARSTIQSLIAIEMKMQAMSLLRGLFSSFAGSFSGGGFGTGKAFGNMDLGGFLAEGGPAEANTPYIIGERGPELFVPRTAGTVIPNNALSSMGGQTINYNGPIIQNMSAIDTQSGLQFLAKNKQGVFAAYQSANRSIPVSR
jgi:phage-related minor tail protein